jgi:hypothetical protein
VGLQVGKALAANDLLQAQNRQLRQDAADARAANERTLDRAFGLAHSAIASTSRGRGAAEGAEEDSDA